MVYIHIPSRDLFEKLKQELSSKYGIQSITRRFVGFKVATNAAVTVVTDANISRIAWQINRELNGRAEGEVVTELFVNNTAFWKVRVSK